ncbi:MAG: TetR family transcriptional regulator [bacterium]|nr:TetR family transcriptional regulator [bacterium]MCP5065858.1 TetR family transcriptional regulator [bacterium]
MQRRKAWRGNPPKTQEEARRFLIDIARGCVERYGVSKASLKDVASEAGVTRQTVYRYFSNAEDLFNAAVVLASGGFLERMRQRVLKREGLAERIVETLVIAIHEIPKDPRLSAMAQSGDYFTVSSMLRLFFVQEEMIALADGNLRLAELERDELSELLLRLLQSFLNDPGPKRSEAELRAYLYKWLIPMIKENL